MERLTGKNNTPEEYDKIFKERENKEPHWHDLKRWKALLRYFKGGNIIDIGCLDSKIYELVEDKVGWYMGTDVATEAIESMQEKFGGVIAQFKEDDIYYSQFPSEVFDYAVMGEILEHLQRPEAAIRQAFRILKPGGILAISVPLEEIREPGAVDGDHHLWSFTREDLTKLCEPFAKKMRFKIVGSDLLPYRYAWPSLICYATKL